MNSRPRPGPPETTASSRTSPTGRGRQPPAPGPRGAGRAIGISGRDSTTARVAVGRDVRFSVTWTDWTPPGPWTTGPQAFGGDGCLLRGQRGGVLVFGGGVRLLPPEDHAASGGLGCLDLGALLTLELLDHRERLVVLERG